MIRCIVVFLSSIVLAAETRYVYQKDVSEYCRRRAVPSVFLSKNVAEANAEMLHFTKLDFPYSCYISIRTESSNNIIMVIQLSSGPDLLSSCAENPDQLIVYESGETFGGYWGPIPEDVVWMNKNGTTPRQYTLKTTQSTTTTTPTPKPVSPSAPEDTEPPKTTTTRRPTENDDVVFEVPLVNISGPLVPGLWKYAQTLSALDDEKKFDPLNDVQPEANQTYSTTMIQLVQISMHTTPDPGYGYWRRGQGSEERLYDLAYNVGPFTPDIRLTTPVIRRKSVMYRNRKLWNLRKRVKATIASNEPLFSTESRINRKPFRKYYDLVKNMHSFNGKLAKTSIKEEMNEDSYKLIEDLVKSLKKGKDFENGYNISTSYVPILKKIADTHHNLSAYLVPWSSYTNVPENKVNTEITKHINNKPWSATKSMSTHSLQVQKTDQTRTSTKEKMATSLTKSTEHSSTEKHVKLSSEHKLPIDSTRRLNEEPKHTFPSTPTKLTTTKAVESTPSSRKEAVASYPELQPLSGTLVDHESWENVVQAAPAIAGRLHRPRLTASAAAPLTGDRRKRSILPIPIHQAKPHARRTSPATTTTARAARVGDMEYLQQLIELPDDETSQRVALRFMRRHAGPSLFNICQQYESEPKLRPIVLLNSSRIILALGNFTISRMTVVVTTARTMRFEPRCPEANIECQVAGTRVCVDSTSACDGIPNCGALDVYDEDRLKCGVKGFVHNVYLAAFAFMALLLTGFYIVHYWLKRCVPKVADAFFIYTDGTENVLYLETIMRSPTDHDFLYKSALRESFEEQVIYTENYENPKSFSHRITSRIFKLMHIKQKQGSILVENDSTDKLKPESRKRFSFTEMELQNITRNWKIEKEVQTGESLELAYMKILNAKPKERVEEDEPPMESRRCTLTLESQKKAVRQNSSRDLWGPSTSAAASTDRPLIDQDDESELGSTLYDNPDQLQDDDDKTTRTIGTSQTRKRLRFDRDFRLAESEGPNITARKSVVLPQSSRPLFRNINSIEGPLQDQDQGPLDIRSFFKGKKSKKKKDTK